MKNYFKINQRALKVSFFSAFSLFTLQTITQAQNVGIYGGNANDTAVGLGMTPTTISDFSAFDFSTVDILWVFNSDNNAYESAFTSRSADLNTFVTSGGKLMFYDRAIGNANATFIPGLSSITTVRDESSDIDIVTPNDVVNGPAGVLDNTSLDSPEGLPISHGYISGGVPSNAVTIFSNGSDPTHAADVSYTLGAGAVYYSSIPLDAYLNSGGGSGNPIGGRLDPGGSWLTCLNNVYAPNLLSAMAAGTASSVAAPEPGTFALLCLGGLAIVKRRRKI
jgi:hypothetical protein